MTLMYGVKCVSAQSKCAMVRIAKEIQEKMPALAEVLLKGQYVDDLADSKATRQEVLEIVKAGNEVFGEDGLKYKGWTVTGEDPLEEVAGDEEFVGVAGQKWFPKIDVTMVNIPPLHLGKIRRGR